jgi:hypothetical protein
MRSSTKKWVSGIGSVLALGILIVASGGVTHAGRPSSNPPLPNPFREVLDRLDDILENLKNGGSREGNHTLRWDRVLPAAQRFVVLTEFNNEAVLDQETGLVWERSPGPGTVNWSGARGYCANRVVGGRRGWRLPAVFELASLVDPTVPSPEQTLPPGHPFLNVQSAPYWTISTVADTPAGAWQVDFILGLVGNSTKADGLPNWCVRGPNQESVY